MGETEGGFEDAGEAPIKQEYPDALYYISEIIDID